MMQEEQSAVLHDFLSACRQDPDVHLTHFLCVSQDGILQQYAEPPYCMDTLRLCFSMTKSFASLAVGIAWGQGLVRLDTKLSELLPEAMPAHGGNAMKIRVRDLLTMSGGVAENNYDLLVKEKDWVKAYFAQDFPSEPGIRYLYCTHGSHVLSAVVERVSGLSLERFLNRYLFHPMGIYEAQWERAPEGHIAGGMGLSLYPASLAKVAQLLLNGGRWEKTQLIPEAYIRMAGSVQIRKHEKTEKTYSGDAYGFQFHVGKDGLYRMDGAFGQICLLCPEWNRAYIALSSGAKTESLLRLIYRYWIDKDAEPVRAPVRAEEACVSGKQNGMECGRYRLKENPMGIRAVQLESVADNGWLTLQFSDANWRIDFAFGRETRGTTLFIKDLETRVQQYVCRAEELQDGLELTVYYIETPYIVQYSLTKSDAGLYFGFKINNSFTLRNFTAQMI